MWLLKEVNPAIAGLVNGWISILSLAPPFAEKLSGCLVAMCRGRIAAEESSYSHKGGVPI